MKTITWTLLIYQLPAKPSTKRVFVWRRLKTLGALYLQHSVCLLPHRDALRAQLAELEREIKERKGEVVVLTIELKDGGKPQRSSTVFGNRPTRSTVSF